MSDRRITELTKMVTRLSTFKNSVLHSLALQEEDDVLDHTIESDHFGGIFCSRLVSDDLDSGIVHDAPVDLPMYISYYI